MPRLSRRSFLAASAAAVAAPALAAENEPPAFAVAVIGAGAAGIAAARRLAAAKARFVLLEAADTVGGRCITDHATFSVPFDRGAHWIHRPADNPLIKAAPGGLDIYPAPRGQKLRVAPRRAREGELEEFLAALVRANRALVEAGRGVDRAAAAALPGDLGVWRDSVEFVLGPYSTGKALSDVSVVDFARAPERNADAFCREGYGTLLAKLAAGLPVQLSTPARRLDWGGTPLLINTPKGMVRTRTAIITVSTAVLGNGGLTFTPELSRSYTDAIANLSLGQYENIALELTGNPLDLDPDDLVYERALGQRTAALLGNVGGSTLSVVSVGGRFARELSRSGEAAMVDFANSWIAGVFGTSVKGRIKHIAVTRWGENALIGGAFSAAAPGYAGARRALMEPLRGRIWFAGEAAHETLWGTVNGAWESGTRAAEAALRAVGGLPEERPAPESRPGPERRVRRKRRRDE